MKPLTIVIGGAASGKSHYAETLVVQSGQPKVYLATAQAYDAEMQAKVDAHRVQRGDDWRTIEAPLDLAGPLADQPADAIVLLDCATMWLNNLMMSDRNLDQSMDDLLTALAAAPCPVVVVTNEVGAGIVPDNALARRFRNMQGQLNQALAAQADTVVTVIAGLPLALKGPLP